MLPNSDFFMLYSNCIPVKGAKRSIICDLQLSRYKFIPNLLVDILKESRNYTVPDLKKKFGNSYDDGIDNFFSSLEADGWGFFTSIPQQFEELDLTWEFPGIISNAIIDIGDEVRIDFKDIISQLSDLGCDGLQVRIFGVRDLSFFKELSGILYSSNIQYCEFYVRDTDLLALPEVEAMLKKYKKTRLFCMYSSSQERVIQVKESKSLILYALDNVVSSDCCGIIHKGYFQPDIQFFTEAQTFNSCLNRKIAIDQEGYIKNCPSTPVRYGHASQVRLESVISDSFSSYWFINKDQIEVCKDCEFRYICSDCRAFTKDPANIYSKPLKCSYDPYKAVWEADKVLSPELT